MKIVIFTIIYILITFTGFAQNPTFEVKFSKPLAVYLFVQNLSDHYPDNPFKTEFLKSVYYKKQYKDLIDQFEAINVSYTYDYDQYPFFSKLPGQVGRLIKKNFIESNSPEDFELQSTGLIPNSDLLKLTSILTQFSPIYDELIYNPHKDKFTEQLQTFSAYVKSKNMSAYFQTGLTFYNSYWDNAIPLIIALYPLPGSKGFTAEALENYAICAMQTQTEVKDYPGLLGIMMHEMFHIVYDEQSQTVKRNLTGWFKNNKLPCANYAYLLLNEAFATVLGNGYVYTQLNGQPDTSAWYNQKYINLMAKKLYPLVDKYIAEKMPVDQGFVNAYIKLYQDNFSNWINELNNLMTYRYVLTDDDADFNAISENYRYSSYSNYDEPISQTEVDKLKNTPVTKLVIVSNDHKNKLQLIRKSFPELKNWKYDEGKDFIYHIFLKDKTQLIIINRVRSSSIDLLKKGFRL